MDELGLNCTVCEEYFSNKRLPRNLRCGHSVCDVCANRILSADRKCPECRQKIKATSTSQMPINQPLLKLAISMGTCPRTSDFGRYQQPAEALPSAPPSLQISSSSSVDAGECAEHENRFYFRCMTCKRWICETCLLSNHRTPPQGHCRTLPIIQALQEMKMSFLQTSASKIQFAEKLKRRLEKEATTLDRFREQTRQATTNLQSLLQEAEIIVATSDGPREEASANAASVQKHMDLLKDRKESVKKATTIDEMECALAVAEEVLAIVERSLLQQQHRQPIRVPLMAPINKQNLKGLLEVVEKGIFVTHFSESHKQRWARVTERDGLLHLHALHMLEEPPNGITIPYESVRKLVPTESPSVFMDIALGNHTRGRVYVRMFGNTARSEQALYLCSGEKGPSYRGTCFYKSENLDKQFEILRGGDYANNNGTGGCAILNGITSGGVYKVEITTGLMVGWPVDDHWRLGSFDFYLKDCPGRYDMSGYGIVTQGIETLRSAARHKPVRDSGVKDCGLVIPV